MCFYANRDPATKTALVVRHVPHEGLGLFEVPLLEAGFDVRYHDAASSPPLSVRDALDASLLVVLGGPMGVYEADAHPFLRDEIAALEARIPADRPTLGVCLGAQLIAASTGARVRPGDRFELGYEPIALTDAGRASCLAPLLDDPRVLHWHGDTYDLPAGATRLASSAAYREQAFSIGPRILGLQFHPEVDAAMLDVWIREGGDELARAGVDAHVLRRTCDDIVPALATRAQAMLRGWLRGAGLFS